MRLFAATRNAGKQREIRRVLEAAGHEVLFPDEAGLYEDVQESLLENADTFEGNARRKAEYFVRRSGLPTFADDSGLEVLSLNGAPGVRSRRFAAVEGPASQVDAANNRELLRRLLGAPTPRRRARFRCVIALQHRPDAVPEIFEGAANGTILEAARGNNGFGYDPLFLSDDLGVTFAEASADDKDRVSHRGRALAALVAALAQF
ncbi:MAG TPA: non-canonical purine NTP pyrophosphatase [Gemmatimonadales bacterium]|nr:non-canonical purine NTP pyrophosphatase [Gemmatimonadales bacterium]